MPRSGVSVCTFVAAARTQRALCWSAGCSLVILVIFSLWVESRMEDIRFDSRQSPWRIVCCTSSPLSASSSHTSSHCCACLFLDCLCGRQAKKILIRGLSIAHHHCWCDADVDVVAEF